MMNQGQEAGQRISSTSTSSGMDFEALRTAVDHVLITNLPKCEEAVNAKYKERIKQLEDEGQKRERQLEMMTLENRKLKAELQEVKDVLKTILEQGEPLTGCVSRAQYIINSTLTLLGAQCLAVEVAIQNAYATQEGSGCPSPATVAATGIVRPQDVVPGNQAVDSNVTSQEEQQQEMLTGSNPPVDGNSNQAQPILLARNIKQETNEQVHLPVPPASFSSTDPVNAGTAGSSTAADRQVDNQRSAKKHMIRSSEPTQKRPRSSTSTRMSPDVDKLRGRGTENVKKGGKDPPGIFCYCGRKFYSRREMQKHFEGYHRD